MLFDLSRKLTTVELDRIIRGSPVSSGVSVTPTTALEHAPVFSCVRVLAETIGQIPLHLYEERPDGAKVKARNHPVYDLLHRAPNGFQTAQEWLEMVIAHQCLAGNHYSYVNWVAGRVVELLPLQPNAVNPMLSEDGAEVRYRVRFDDGSQDVLDSREILHIRTFTLDGFTGVSPIRFTRESIGLDVAVQQHASALFRNGASPRGVLSTDQILSDESYARIRADWERNHSGRNAHRMAILEAGLQWAAVGMSAEDAQMLESRRFGKVEICGIFRVPPSLIGELSGGTYSNTEQQARSFVDLTLMPYFKRIEDRVTWQLLSEADRARHFAKFNVNALVRGDMNTRANFYTRQLMNGAMSPNEIRELEDMNPRAGGDTFLQPANMQPSGAGAAPSGAPPADVPPGAPTGGNPPGENPEEPR